MSNVVTASAATQLGKPYVFDTPLDASNPNPATFDCSGLTMWCYQKAGIVLPHNAAAQYAIMTKKPLDQAQAGDVMFWMDGGTIGHCAIYMGDGTIIEAPEPGKFVQQMPYAYWKQPLSTVGSYTGDQQTPTENAVTTANLAVAQGVGTATGGAGSSLSFGNLFTDLTSKTFWSRIGIGALGALVLLIILWEYVT